MWANQPPEVLNRCAVHTCFKQTTIVPDTLDPLQFAYRPNRSTDDTITVTVHTALSHLEKGNTYVRMLFIDYSSAFNTIVPAKLIPKLRIFGLNTSLCNWNLDSDSSSSVLALYTGAPYACVLSHHLDAMVTSY